MKVILIITAAFAFFSYGKQANGQASVYHPFPDSNAYWKWEGCGGPPPLCGSQYGSLNGDTIVNSTLYRKYYQFGKLFGGIRNDHAAKKTYFICLSSQPSQCSSHISEKILYDFSAGIGDTVMWSTCGYNLIVTDIDSVLLLDGTYRKRFLSSGNVVEGIGANSPMCAPCMGMICLNLLCFNKDSTFYIANAPNSYNPEFPKKCNAINSNDEYNFPAINFQISPNPTSGRFQITSPQTKIRKVIVTDVLGRIAFRQTLFVNQWPVIDITDNKKGIYLVKVIDESGNSGVKKIVLE